MSQPFSTQIGEGFAGTGADAAHVNTVLGALGGPVETAWATSLATPTTGYARFLVVARPGVAVQPPTLFVAKAEIADPGSLHATLTWGAAQAGVAAGVGAALRGEAIEPDGKLLIAAVWVSPSAADEDAVYENNRIATIDALVNGVQGGPSVAVVLEAAADPWNPFFRGDRGTA